MILLLTGCINPKGMSFTVLSNQEERKVQYIKAIQYYLSNTKYKIVFTENSCTDLSPLFQKAIESERMEYLTFDGNQNKERGKGYGECEIIEYALSHSKLIRLSKDHRIIKITGRLIVRNIVNILKLHKFLFSSQTVICAINSDLSFPDSRLMIASISFYKRFLQSKQDINDSKGHFFEHVLRDTLIKEKEFSYSPFLIMPQIEGMSGSTGVLYNQLTPSTFNFYIKYVRYAISILWKFKRLYRT